MAAASGVQSTALCGVPSGRQRSLQGHVARQAMQLQNVHRRVGVCVRAQSAQGSYDAEEELDTDLAAELGSLRSPEAWKQLQQHMDLVWSVSRNRGSRAPCTSCGRSGEAECHWCHGTGALMVGDTMFCSTEGHCNCPVCNGKGYLKCQECRGTGFRAAWMSGSGPIRTNS